MTFHAHFPHSSHLCHTYVTRISRTLHAHFTHTSQHVSQHVSQHMSHAFHTYVMCAQSRTAMCSQPFTALFQPSHSHFIVFLTAILQLFTNKSHAYLTPMSRIFHTYFTCISGTFHTHVTHTSHTLQCTYQAHFTHTDIIQPFAHSRSCIPSQLQSLVYSHLTTILQHFTFYILHLTSHLTSHLTGI
jgi:hypothetical protein